MARWIKRGTARVPPPVTNMLFHIALLFLAGHTDASPTIVELINSGLSLVGAKYVPPPSSEAENEIGTRQTTCRDCSRKVNATPGFHLRRTTVFFLFQGRFAFDMFGTATTAPVTLPCCAGTNSCAKCGLEKTRRVIGGVETAAGVYPWIAALSYGSSLGGCSATLVSSNWAITAAHCIFSSGPTSLVLGEHDLSSSNDADDTNRQAIFPYLVTFCPLSGRRFQ